jgi:hypothetical protein
LIEYIDDATNELFGAVFRDEADAAGYFIGLQLLCLQTCIPGAIYADQHTIFQGLTKVTIEQALAGEQLISQFGQLKDDPGIELIFSECPQAKWLIERLRCTFQDRLVKALREAGASNMEEAHQLLASFLPKDNQRFKVKPAQEETAYVTWLQEYRAKDYYCYKDTRTITNDNTSPFYGHRCKSHPVLRERA